MYDYKAIGDLLDQLRGSGKEAEAWGVFNGLSGMGDATAAAGGVAGNLDSYLRTRWGDSTAKQWVNNMDTKYGNTLFDPKTGQWAGMGQAAGQKGTIAGWDPTKYNAGGMGIAGQGYKPEGYGSGAAGFEGSTGVGVQGDGKTPFGMPTTPPPAPVGRGGGIPPPLGGSRTGGAPVASPKLATVDPIMGGNVLPPTTPPDPIRAGYTGAPKPSLPPARTPTYGEPKPSTAGVRQPQVNWNGDPEPVPLDLNRTSRTGTPTPWTPEGPTSRGDLQGTAGGTVDPPVTPPGTPPPAGNPDIEDLPQAKATIAALIESLKRGDTPKPFDLFNDEGYQFRKKEGMDAIENAASARGSLRSGQTLKDLVKFNQGHAADEYDKAYQRSDTDRKFAETQYQYSNNDAFKRAVDNRDFNNAEKWKALGFTEEQRRDARDFDYRKYVGDRSYDTGLDQWNKEFGYKVESGDKQRDMTTLMELVRSGVLSTQGSGNLAGELSRILADLGLTGAGAEGSAGVGGANSINGIVSQLLKYLSSKNSIPT
jgi:hypothetical protein